jgi:YbbR domain-containing protein
VLIFPSIIRRNWQLKLSAFALAVLLWTVPELGKEGRQVFEDVPVRVQLNDPQWAVTQDPIPASVRVTLTGPTRSLVALEMDRPSIVVPVDRVVSQDTTVVLRSPWVRMSVGDNIVVEEINPNFVELSFEAMAVYPVPLAASFQGELPSGLSLAMEPEVTPALTRVSGPRSQVEDLQSLTLQAVDLSQVDESDSFSALVDTVGLSGLTFSPQEATVRLVVEETVQRTLDSIPVDVPLLSPGPQILARPAFATVLLTGARSLVDAVDPDSVRVTFSRSVAASLSPGEQARVSLSVEGLEPLIRPLVVPEWVLLRRPAGQ